MRVVHGFRVPLVSASYMFAIILLSMHIYHGLWSMFQSVGISHPRYTPVLKSAAHAITIVIAAGYLSIPVSVLLGLIGQGVQ